MRVPGGVVAAVCAVLGAALTTHAFPVFNSEMPPGRTLDQGNFTLTQHGAWLVEFFLPTCPHCQAFAPFWHDVEVKAEPLRTDFPEAPLTMARVDCQVSMDLCEQEGVTGVPRVSLYHDGKVIDRDLDAPRNVDELYSAVATTAAIYRGFKGVVGSKPNKPAGGAAGLPAAAAAAPASAANSSAVAGSKAASSAPAPAAPLEPLNPEETVFPYGQAPLDTREALAKYLREDHGQGPSFVKFFVPWCPHCRSMAEDFRRLGAKTEGQVHAIEVDCQIFSDLCDEYGVNAYPTLRLYTPGKPNGTEVAYEPTVRTFTALMTWLVRQGVYRVLRHVDAAEFDRTVHESSVTFLYVRPRNTREEQRRAVEEAYLNTGVSVPYLWSEDETLLRQYAETGDHAALLVFKDGDGQQPAATLSLDRLHTAVAVEQITAFVEQERFPTLAEAHSTDVHEVLRSGPSAVPVVLAVLRSQARGSQGAPPLDAQLEAFHRVARDWTHQAPSALRSLRFVWLDYDQLAPVLASKYHVRVDSAPALLYLQGREHKLAVFDEMRHWLDGERATEWIKAAHSGLVPMRPFGSMLEMGMFRARSTGSSLGEIMQDHPLLALVSMAVAIAALVPRVRHAVLRPLRGSTPRTLRKGV